MLAPRILLHPVHATHLSSVFRTHAETSKNKRPKRHVSNRVYEVIYVLRLAWKLQLSSFEIILFWKLGKKRVDLVNFSNMIHPGDSFLMQIEL